MSFFNHAPGPDLDYTAYVNSSKMRNNTVHRYYFGGSRQGRPHKNESGDRFTPVPFDKLMVLSKAEGHRDKVPRRQ